MHKQSNQDKTHSVTSTPRAIASLTGVVNGDLSLCVLAHETCSPRIHINQCRRPGRGLDYVAESVHGPLGVDWGRPCRPIAGDTGLSGGQTHGG